MSLLSLDKSDFDRIDGFNLDKQKPGDGVLDRFEIYSAIEKDIFKGSPEKQNALKNIDGYMDQNFELGLKPWHSENFAKAELLGDFQLIDKNGDNVLSEKELEDKEIMEKLSPVERHSAEILKSRFKELADTEGIDGMKGISDWRKDFKADQFKLFEPVRFSDLNWGSAPSKGF